MAEYRIQTDICSPILKPDTFHICKGEIFKLNEMPPYADSFSLDSGKHWHYFPSIIDTTLSGIFDIGFKFRKIVSPWVENIGTDSIKLHKDSLIFYDTVFRQQKVWIHSDKKDSLYMKVYGKCRPFRVSIFFKSGYFDKGEKLQIIWGSGPGGYDTTFTKSTIIDSVMHYYNVTALSNEIQIVMENVRGCKTRTKFFVERGKAISIARPGFLNCIKDSVCISPYIYDMIKQTYWTGNSPGNTVKWFAPDENISSSDFKTCFKFKSGGMKAIRLMVSDSIGCRDTLTDTVFIQDVKAGMKKSGLTLYCNELKRFFDSSSYITNPKYHNFFPKYYKDSIKKYSWKFGDNVFNSFQKNPLQSINTSLDSIRAAHAVETVNGCSDTLHFTIKMIGPKPYFQIRDTIGCGSLEAHFVNLSRNSKHYIWQFGDSLKTNLQVSNKNEISFTYTKPGRYYISLVGIDTIFNPITNSLQACINTFPDKLFQKDTYRTVLVLPFKKTGINSIDTICVNQILALKSLSDSAYVRDLWLFDDSSSLDTLSGSTAIHRYKKTGNYNVQLKPNYLDPIKNECRDSANKTIYVIGVDADFDIDPGSKAPVFLFHNTSKPLSSLLLWDFGQNGSSDNTSNASDPSKNYGNDTGSYLVCLIASIPQGCKDTICKEILNDYLNAFAIPNVFTPEKPDGLNDKYDIEIEGESMYNLKIYDRWGILVYESDKDFTGNEEGNWNGKMKNTGSVCPSATYYYIFSYILKSDPGETKTIHGIIQLIR